MRESIRQFAELIAETLPIREPIYEFGSFQVPGQEGFADLRPFFPGKRYVGCDRRAGPGVDQLIDVCATGLPPASVGTILCFDMLEHVESPREAVDEMARLLVPGGLLAIGSVLDFPIHEAPEDYWRFTPDAFRLLLRPLTGAFANGLGDESFPHTVLGIGFKDAAPSTDRFHGRFEEWRRTSLPPRLARALGPFLPPLLLRRFLDPRR